MNEPNVVDERTRFLFGVALVGALIAGLIGGVLIAASESNSGNAEVASKDGENSKNIASENRNQTQRSHKNKENKNKSKKNRRSPRNNRPPRSWREDFESLNPGVLGENVSCESSVGTWTSGGGLGINGSHDAGQKHLHFYGGPKRTITLTLAKEIDTSGDLELTAERWNEEAPFAFTVEKLSGDGWHPLAMRSYSDKIGVRKEKGKGRPVPWLVTYELNDTEIEKLRFVCDSKSTAPEQGGVLIGEIKIIESTESNR